MYLSLAEDFMATNAAENFITYVGGGIALTANDYGLGNYNYRFRSFNRDGIMVNSESATEELHAVGITSA